MRIALNIAVGNFVALTSVMAIYNDDRGPAIIFAVLSSIGLALGFKGLIDMIKKSEDK